MRGSRSMKGRDVNVDSERAKRVSTSDDDDYGGGGGDDDDEDDHNDSHDGGGDAMMMMTTMIWALDSYDQNSAGARPGGGAIQLDHAPGPAVKKQRQPGTSTTTDPRLPVCCTRSSSLGCDYAMMMQVQRLSGALAGSAAMVMVMVMVMMMTMTMTMTMTMPMTGDDEDEDDDDDDADDDEDDDDIGH
eukprot:1424622-Rhodomonas_salina.2